MKDLCPIIQLVTKPNHRTAQYLIENKIPYGQMNKEELVMMSAYYDDRAFRYSRTDWEEHNRADSELKKIDIVLLDIYSKENETFLQTHPST